MNATTPLRHYRIAAPLILAAMLLGCGQGDDMGKVEKKEPPAPPKAATPAPAPAKETPKPAPPAVQKASAKAEAEGWILLGSQQANFKSETDRITVESSKKPVKELLVVVEGAPLHIEELLVTFRSDKQHKAHVKQDLAANSASRSIDLPGEKRGIKHLDFVYRTTAKGGGKAVVMVYGR
jgi:hypothetical protein